MNTSKLRSFIIIATLLNVSVLLAIVWAGWGRAWQAETTPALEDYLQLNAQQVLQWRQAEQGFLVQLEGNESAIHQQRNALIESIFAEQLVLNEVHRAQLALAKLQNEQQHIVVEQLLAERAILTPQQRLLLQQLLTQQAIYPSQFEQLHKNQN